MLPGLVAVGAVGNEQPELALVVFNFDCKQAVGVARDVDQFHAAVAEQVVGAAKRTLVVVPVEAFEVDLVSPLRGKADRVHLAVVDVGNFRLGSHDVLGALELVDAVGVVAVEVGD